MTGSGVVIQQYAVKVSRRYSTQLCFLSLPPGLRSLSLQAVEVDYFDDFPFDAVAEMISAHELWYARLHATIGLQVVISGAIACMSFQ